MPTCYEDFLDACHGVENRIAHRTVHSHPYFSRCQCGQGIDTRLELFHPAGKGKLSVGSQRRSVKRGYEDVTRHSVLHGYGIERTGAEKSPQPALLHQFPDLPR